MSDGVPSSCDGCEESQFLGELLRASAGEIAHRTARRLEGMAPKVYQRYAPMPADRWRTHFLGRVHDLAAAISVEAPEIFAQQIAWAKIAFKARGLPMDDIRQSLVALMDVLEAELPVEDRAQAAAYILRGLSEIDRADDGPPTNLTVSTPQGDLAARYLLAVLEGDRHRASTLVVDAVRQGRLTAPDAYLRVITPVQRELGRMWHLGEISVAEEHFATATTQLTLSMLYPFLPRRGPRNLTVIAASVEGNVHDLGVRMVADFFEMDGWKTIYLGANVPPEDLAVAAAHFSADLVAVSACLPTQLRAVEDTVLALRRHGFTSPILVGGPAFSLGEGLWRQMGADGYSPCAESAPGVGLKLVQPN